MSWNISTDYGSEDFLLFIFGCIVEVHWYVFSLLRILSYSIKKESVEMFYKVRNEGNRELSEVKSGLALGRSRGDDIKVCCYFMKLYIAVF